MRTAGPQTGKLLGVSWAIPRGPPGRRGGGAQAALRGKLLTGLTHSPSSPPSRHAVACYSVAKLCQTLQPHRPQHSRLACPPLAPRVCSDSCIILNSIGFHFHHQTHPQLSIASALAQPLHSFWTWDRPKQTPASKSLSQNLLFEEREPNEAPSSSASPSFYATPFINKA